MLLHDPSVDKPGPAFSLQVLLGDGCKAALLVVLLEVELYLFILLDCQFHFSRDSSATLRIIYYHVSLTSVNIQMDKL